MSKIKLQNISDFYLDQSNNELCQFFIVRDDYDKPNLVMVYKNFNDEKEILDFIEGIRIADTSHLSKTLH